MDWIKSRSLLNDGDGVCDCCWIDGGGDVVLGERYWMDVGVWISIVVGHFAWVGKES